MVVSNNNSTNTMGQFIRLAASWPARIVGNVVERHPNAERGTTISIEATIGFRGVGRIGATDVEIAGNSLRAQGFDNYGIAATSYDFAVPSRTISIHHNLLRDFRVAIAVGGPVEDMSINHNSILGERYGSGIRIRGTGGGITMSSIMGVEEKRSAFLGLSISSNEIRSVGFDVFPIEVNLRKPSGYRGHVGTVSITANTIRATERWDTAAIIVDAGRDPPDGVLIVRDNNISRFGAVLHAAGFKQEIVDGNRLLQK